MLLRKALETELLFQMSNVRHFRDSKEQMLNGGICGFAVA